MRLIFISIEESVADYLIGRDYYLGHDFLHSQIGRDCFTNVALQLDNLWLKIGNRVFRLEGQVSSQDNWELATALKSAQAWEH